MTVKRDPYQEPMVGDRFKKGSTVRILYFYDPKLGRWRVRDFKASSPQGICRRPTKGQLLNWLQNSTHLD